MCLARICSVEADIGHASYASRPARRGQSQLYSAQRRQERTRRKGKTRGGQGGDGAVLSDALQTSPRTSRALASYAQTFPSHPIRLAHRAHMHPLSQSNLSTTHVRAPGFAERASCDRVPALQRSNLSTMFRCLAAPYEESRGPRTDATHRWAAQYGSMLACHWLQFICTTPTWPRGPMARLS